MYKIILSPKAKNEIRDYARYIRKSSQRSAVARDWSQRIYEKIAELSTMPRRFAIIPESEYFPFELRQFIHFSHRVIYGIDDVQNRIMIYRVYHAARRDLENGDLQ